jgi:hypothetical protein
MKGAGTIIAKAGGSVTADFGGSGLELPVSFSTPYYIFRTHSLVFSDE